MKTARTTEVVIIRSFYV